MTAHEGIAGTEIKVGLTIIAVLIVALCWTIARRFLVSNDIPPAEVRSGMMLQTIPNGQNNPIEPRPMVLPPQDRYSGPENYIEPQTLESSPETASENDEPFDHRPSLLPALPANEHYPPRSAQLPQYETIDSLKHIDTGIQYAPYIEPEVPSESTNQETDEQHKGIHSRDTEIDQRSIPSQPMMWGNPRESQTSSIQDQPLDPMATKPSWKEDAKRATTVSVFKPSVRSVSHAEPFIRKPEILPVDYSLLRPGRKYQVKKGDTLQAIAKSELGDAERWPDVHYLNRGCLGPFPTPLQPGIEIVLPAPIAH